MQTATLDKLMAEVSALPLEDQVELQNRLARLLELEEDQLDLEAVRRAESESVGEATVPWRQLKQELGL